MSKLMVVGAINTDLIAFVERAPQAGETVAGGHFEQHGGGKGANQAVAAARSGADVVLLSATGADGFGEAQRAALTQEGIDMSGVVTLDSAASGVAIIIVESGGENRICDLPGARQHLTEDHCLQVIDASGPAAILATNELPQSCLQILFRRAAEQGIPVWFNAAPYSDSARSLLPEVNTLIVNRGEAEDILDVRGENWSTEQLVSGLVALGVISVILTLGGEGVTGMDHGQHFDVAAVPVEAIDSTGAGDTFCGAWAAAVMNGATFASAVNYANRAAAISVTGRGAQSSIPTRAEVEGQ